MGRSGTSLLNTARVGETSVLENFSRKAKRPCWSFTTGLRAALPNRSRTQHTGQRDSGRQRTGQSQLSKVLLSTILSFSPPPTKEVHLQPTPRTAVLSGTPAERQDPSLHIPSHPPQVAPVSQHEPLRSTWRSLRREQPAAHLRTPRIAADLPHAPLPLPTPSCLKQSPLRFTRLLSQRRAGRHGKHRASHCAAAPLRSTAAQREPRVVSAGSVPCSSSERCTGCTPSRGSTARHLGVQTSAFRSYSRRSTARSHSCSRGFGRAQHSMRPGPQRAGGCSVQQPRNLSPTAPSFHPTHGRYAGRRRAPLSPTGARRSGGGRRWGRGRERRGVPERSAG